MSSTCGLTVSTDLQESCDMFEGHRLKGHSLFTTHGSMVMGEREILLEDFEGGITRF